MAKRGYGFRDRFPHFGLFLVLAVALAIPLTVWSLNHASTNTNQEAAAITCGVAPKTWTCSNSICDGCWFSTGRCGTSGCFYDHKYLSNTCGAGCVPTTPTPAVATPAPSSCTTGTGNTNASCGGFAYYAIQSSSRLCCEYTYRCSNNSCTAACHNTSINQSLCSSSGPTPTPTQTPRGSTCATNGGTCNKYSCPSGTTSISGTCGAMTDSVCCAPAITTASTTLKASYSRCTLYTLTFTANINLSWSSIPGATGYGVYWYDTTYGELISSGSKKVTGTSTTISPLIARGGQFFWYVKGTNAYSSGPASAKQEIVFSCNKI